MGTRGPDPLPEAGCSGSHSCQCRTQGLRPRGADRAPGRRGEVARGGARGAGRRRGGGTGWRLRLGAPRSPAPRAASAWSKARSVQSGERSPERQSKGGRKGCLRVATRDPFPFHNPAPGSRWRWRRAADGVHLSREQAGEAGRSGASPALRRSFNHSFPHRTRATPAADRHSRSVSVPRRGGAQDPSDQPAALRYRRHPLSGSPRRPPGSSFRRCRRTPSSSSSLSLLPPSAHGLLCPVAAAAASILATRAPQRRLPGRCSSALPGPRGAPS